MMFCKYCSRAMFVSQSTYEENPFCKHCLTERTLKAEIKILKEQDAAVRTICRPFVRVDATVQGEYLVKPPPLSLVVEQVIETLRGDTLKESPAKCEFETVTNLYVYRLVLSGMDEVLAVASSMNEAIQKTLKQFKLVSEDEVESIIRLDGEVVA